MIYDSTKQIEESIEIEAPIEEKESLAIPVVIDPKLKGIIRVYQNSIPWNNRSNATLLSLGKVLGVDYFIHPITDLFKGVPEKTTVVLISSNSAGNTQAAAEESNEIVQRNLECYVRHGGILIVDMADNLTNGGYLAPGCYGTPDLIFPDSAAANEMFLTPESYCNPFVNGPTITLTDDNIDMPPGYRYSAHGNLEDGITIPKRSEKLMTAIFNGVKKPILAYYYLGDGFVIVDTVTKEFIGQNPVGLGPSNILTNLFYFAYYLSTICFY